MSGKAEPVLVLDLGGTLLNRAGLGAFRRALAAVAGLGRDTEQQGVRDCVARAVLTGATAAVAAATLARDLQLPDDRRVLEALLQPEGDVALATGAPGLLRAGADNGWRIVAATNAAAWLPPLPDSIRSFFFAEATSTTPTSCLRADPAISQCRREPATGTSPTWLTGWMPRVHPLRARLQRWPATSFPGLAAR